MKLNGQTVPNPQQNPQITYIEVARSQRAITGRTRKDVIAVKYSITLNYHGLKPAEAAIFIDAYKAGGLVTYEFLDYDGLHTISAYITTLSREQYAYEMEYPTNISVTIEEAL